MSFFIHDRVGLTECPYLERWIFDFKYFSIRLHKWVGSDDQRYAHDHGWWFWTFVLRGAYLNITNAATVIMHPGSLAFRTAVHQHKVLLLTKPCWTLLLTGAESREWGFWVNGKFKKRNRYFYDFKHHQCD